MLAFLCAFIALWMWSQSVIAALFMVLILTPALIALDVFIMYIRALTRK